MDEGNYLEASGPNSDDELAALLDRAKKTMDPDEMQKLSDQIERVVFHKQFSNT